MKNRMKLNASWSDDCQGKKDYDAEIVGITTRYWPSNYQSNGKMSAHCELIIRFHDDEIKVLDSKEFEADTEQAVKLMVERWAQEKMDWVVEKLPRATTKKELLFAIIAAILGTALGLIIAYYFI